MRSLLRALPGLSDWMIILFLLFCILWKGGKGIEPTWLLVGVAAAVLLLTFISPRGRRRPFEEVVEGTGHAVLGAFERPARGVPTVLWVLLLLYFLWSAASQAFSATANYGLDEILRDGGFILLFFWAVRRPVTVNERELSFAEKLLFTLALAAIGASIVGVLVYVLQPVNRFVGTFFDMRFHTDYWPNAWAEFLLLAWPLVWWLSAKMRAWGGVVALGFVLGALLLSYSRGAFLVLAGQVVLLACSIGIPWVVRAWRGQERERGAWLPFWRLLLAGVIALVVFLGVNALRAQFHEVESVARKATFTAQEGRSSVDERRAFWQQSWLLAAERPLVGWGPYSFRFLQPQFQQGILETSDHAHNVFLKLASERGWPAAGAFLLFISVVFAAGCYRLILAPGTLASPLRSILAVAFIGCAGVLAHNLIDYNLQFVGIALPFWLLLALVVSLAWEPAAERGWRRRITASTEALLGVALVVVALWEGQYLVQSSLGRRAEAAGRVDEAIRRYDAARPQWFSRDMHLSRTQLLLDRQRTDDAERALADYFAQNAEDTRAWRLRGDIAFLRQRYDEALAAYDEALRRGQYNTLGPLYSVLKVLSITEDAASLAARKAEFDRLLADYAAAIAANTHFIALSANVEQLRDTADLLSLLYPEDAERYRALSAQVWEEAQEERSRLSARSRGYLW